MMVMILLRKAESSAASLAPHIVTTLSVAGERHEAEMPKAEVPKAGRCPKQSCPFSLPNLDPPRCRHCELALQSCHFWVTIFQRQTTKLK